jgi:hypothetical protein
MSSRERIITDSKAPAEEQEICKECGLCCDGTLFSFAGLYPGERSDLPEKIKKKSFTEGDKDYFYLPCLYFSGKCTIYTFKRADVCSSYRCQLLKDLSEGKMTMDVAHGLVRKAIKMRTEIMEQYRTISGEKRKTYFKKLLTELGKIGESLTEGTTVCNQYDLLLARCNIFEALLIKYFRSEGDFEKMTMR